MREYVKKLVPFLSCDINAIENWLNNMAKKGLFYVKSGALFAKFEVGEPKARHYKLEYENIVTGRIPADKQAMYEEFGWTVLDDIRPDLVVVCTDDDDYADDEEITIDKISALEKIHKKHRGLGIMYVVLWFLSINPLPLLGLLFGSSKVKISNILSIGTNKYIFCAIVGALLLLEGIYRLIHSGRMKKYIESLMGRGQPPEEKSNTVLCAVMTKLSIPLVLIWIVAALSYTPLFLTTYYEPVYELGEYDFPLLDEINEDEWKIILNYVNEENNEPLLSIDEHKDLLANNMYQIFQDNTGLTNGGAYIDYNVSYYDMKKEEHAVMLMDETAEEWRDNDYMCTEKEYETDGCQVKYYKDVYNDYNNDEVEWQGLIILYKNEIVIVSYQGASDLSEYVDLYISYLKK